MKNARHYMIPRPLAVQWIALLTERDITVTLENSNTHKGINSAGWWVECGDERVFVLISGPPTDRPTNRHRQHDLIVVPHCTGEQEPVELLSRIDKILIASGATRLALDDEVAGEG
jgi:hypothetical protein